MAVPPAFCPQLRQFLGFWQTYPTSQITKSQRRTSCSPSLRSTKPQSRGIVITIIWANNRHPTSFWTLHMQHCARTNFQFPRIFLINFIILSVSISNYTLKNIYVSCPYLEIWSHNPYSRQKWRYCMRLKCSARHQFSRCISKKELTKKTQEICMEAIEHTLLELLWEAVKTALKVIFKPWWS